MELCSILTELQSLKTHIDRTRPAYSLGHILKTLLVLYKSSPMGRKKLAKHLGLGEGSVRSLLSKLRDLDLVKIDKIGGCELTSKGRFVVSKILNNVRIAVCSCCEEICPWRSSVVMSIRDCRDRILSVGVLKLRDLAVKNGAEGLTTILFEESKFVIPDNKLNPIILYPCEFMKTCFDDSCFNNVLKYMTKKDVLMIFGFSIPNDIAVLNFLLDLLFEIC